MRKFVASAAVLVALIAPAGALERELPMAPEISAVRYARTYDKAHLAAHPDQLIRAVRLSIIPPNAEHPEAPWFNLQFELRGRSRPLRTTGFCLRDGDGLRCVVECDGGGVNLTTRGDHVIMRLDSRGIRVTAACGEEATTGLAEDGEMVTGGKDDRVFRLDRVKR